MKQRVATSLGGIVLVLAIQGCGHLNSTSAGVDVRATSLSKVDSAFVQIKDADSASTALNQLLAVVDARTGARSNAAVVFTKSDTGAGISDDLKSKVIALELKCRGKSGVKSKAIGTAENDSDDVQSLIQETEDRAKLGLSAQQIADALNAATSEASLQIASVGAKVANTVNPYTANDVELIRQKTLALIPHSGDPTSGITPMESLVIGYAAASDDDGEKPDGTVKLFASDDMKARYIEKIVATQEGSQQ